MKKFAIIIAVSFLSALGNLSFGQNVIKIENCNDSFMQHQADSIKELLAKDGFVVLRENNVNMRSEYELPIVLPMMQGSLYQFVFIGDMSSRLYEVRMYDWNEKQVVFQQKRWGDVDGNIISYNFIPQFTEYHMIKPVQVNKKKKNMCGYFLLFKKMNAPAKPTAAKSSPDSEQTDTAKANTNVSTDAVVGNPQ